jgi:phage terminase small subunit
MARGPSKGEQALKPRHRLFAYEYLTNKNNAAKAYRAIYPNASPATAETEGPALLRSPQVSAFVADRQRAALQKVALTAEVKLERILLELHRILDIDPLELWTDTRTMKNLEDIPEDARRAISSMKVAEIFEGQGDARRLVGYLREVKFNAKTDASQQLLRVLGAFKDKLEVDHTFKSHAELVAEAMRRYREKHAGDKK